MSALEILVTSIFTMMIWSILYRENSFYGLAQSIYIGLALGYTISRFTDTLYGSVLIPLASGEISYLFVIFFGLLILSTLSKKYRYLARWSMSLLIGVGTGLAVRGGIYPMVINQIKGITRPIIVSSPTGSINNIIILIGTLTSLSYFFFTVKQTPATNNISKIGRIFLMVLLGAGFAGGIIENISFVISLMMDFNKPVAWWPIPLALILIAFDYSRSLKKT